MTEFKNIHIEWRHYDRDGLTCERCNKTGQNVHAAIQDLGSELKRRHVRVTVTETTLPKERMAESNSLFFDGTPIESLLEGVSVSENECTSCSCLAQETTCCRTVVQEETVHEDIPKEMIIEAIRKAVIAAKRKPCCCQAESPKIRKGTLPAGAIPFGITTLIGWGILYYFLPAIAQGLTYRLLGLAPATRLGSAVAFFWYETPKVMMLLVLIVFAVGIVRSFFTPERTRRMLAGRRESIGNVLAALLGVVTPFCSCSAVPLFIGFVTTGVPLGVTFSFLVSAPMVNEVAVVLLYGLFGWKVAALYMGTGLLIAMASGWVIGRLKLEGWVEEWVYAVKTGGAGSEERLDWGARVRYGWNAVKEIVGKVWPYVIAGIAIGAAIHGYVPEDFMASIMGKSAWWSVPAAVLIGVPMYSNAAGIIPIVQALLEKGAALGTVLAFMMSVIALSFPEMVILRKVLKPKLIAAFAGIVAFGILIVGYLFNLLF